MVIRPDLGALTSQLGPAPLTRFAPSPTGYLHLGHVVNAIYVWGLAAALDGRVLLRVEDHDRIRSRPIFESALLDDLNWLGFRPDTGRDPLLRQSDDTPAYEEALQRLRHTHHVYACACSRKDIGSDRYPGTCRARGLAESRGHGLRVEMATEEESGDLLLRDRDGHWTYQFAVTVDDWRQDVSLVIRGADLLSSTGRQIALARMLGRPVPAVFVHHPLLLGATGEKLSKSSGDTGIRELRSAGVSPADVIGRAAAAIGLIDRARPLPAREVGNLFR
jgi:glutamyl-tRNA synthetase/glutamyl-Q tRNA(Asp) synthetase